MSDKTKIINNIDELSPITKFLTSELVRQLNKIKLPMSVFETYRTFDRQNYLYSKGRDGKGIIVTNARGGSSIHNYGCAVDVVDNERTWNYSKYEDEYNRMMDLAKMLGFECGGYWSIRDYPHLQVDLGYSISEIKKMGKIPESLFAGQKKNNLCKVMQDKLKYLGYIISVDGQYGNNTKQVISQFQDDNGLLDNGICDVNTLKLIYKQYSDKLYNLVNKKALDEITSEKPKKSWQYNIGRRALIKLSDAGFLDYSYWENADFEKDSAPLWMVLEIYSRLIEKE